MNVSLTTELKELVESKVSSGRYKSASEVVREALRLLEERDELQAAHFEAVRRQIADGVAELDSGKGINGEQAVASVLTEIEERKKKRR